ncbi:glucose-6-phosphate dehydrogenase assembly protein OpcA [Nocardia donostiensis]|uniref:Glucose-6-phosphate dehydrogenase assembly protein OpcA n=1 Tax=Nocardia donostiensis TaxID=1538463 RepID=A0A1W0B0J1_9NOCA|nr:glucose-6-phosphate dehydrogenase assembly protein OpcA [Nocardia donostiensis]ONM50352.1 glucose-6-phosphate dehydrogenase assembly protein OpcA [Nocardia donostiensis]OQS16015.1 glucose-6-phosphate dehydrogenase assembly protein OpcA [Nocardia donostiensis]OQS23747.1 glucose-6-phosphate dehydrogenase assembly protein OpcA [Nocardia donostiensis]
MIIDMPGTTTGEVTKRLVRLREDFGVITMGRVLTLVVCTLDSSEAEGAIEAANEASHEHPCRVVVLARGDRETETRLDAQIRVGGDAGAAEVIVLRLQGQLVNHEDSVVIPFLLPDTPVVAWWPRGAPEFPSQDSVGRLAARRITDATFAADPQATIKRRRCSYAVGDTDLAWSRITYWRALLTAAMDEPPYEPVRSVTVSGLRDEPALDILAGWLASRLDCAVHRRTGPLRVELRRSSVSIAIARPQTGVTATLTRTGEPDQRIALARRETRDCLAEELRRLDADDIYAEALAGIERVTYDQ